MRGLKVLLLAGLVAAGCGQRVRPSLIGPGRALTVDEVVDSRAITGVSPGAPQWAPDGEHFAFIWREEPTAQGEVWLADRDGGRRRQLTGEEDLTSGVRQFMWDPGGDSLLFVRGDVLWRTDLEARATPVCSGLGRASRLDLSPNGELVAFLRDGDLWVCELVSGSVRRLTSVSVPTVSSLTAGRYARRDVEIGPYIWGGPTHAWAPDSSTIAVHHVDRRHLPTESFPDFLAAGTEPNPVRRGYPGDPNEARRVGLVTVATGELQFLDLPEPTENRIVDFSWSSGGRLLIDRDSDTAVDRWLHVYDPANATLQEIWHDSRETRVYTSAGSTWHPDGEHVLFLGDLADRYGLYMVGGGLDEPRLLSNPDFDVTSSPRVAAGGSAVFYESNEPNPAETHVFRVSLSGGAPERVTKRAGQSRAYPSPDGERVAILHSNDTTPSELYLAEVGSAEPARRLTHSQPPAFDRRPWGQVRYATFPSSVDGATVHARIVEPRGLDRSDRRPVVFGPVYSNTVRNRWGGRWGLIQQQLVERGFIVVQVDVRGSTGYGREFREGFLADFAGKDLEDLASAVEFMKTQPGVDPRRFGVWGSSYGGTLTVYALLKKPELFMAGVAGAAAVDPYAFGGDDVAIVRRPSTHPEAFTRGAAQYAKNLRAKLLFIHGMQDQVVPFRTTVALAEELMRQGKDFDFAFAARANHGWTGRRHHARYLIAKLVDHFTRHLRPGS